MDKGLTVPKWVLIFGPNFNPKCPRMCLPNLFAQAQKFRISMKKGFIGRPLSVNEIDLLCYDSVKTAAVKLSKHKHNVLK